MVAEKILQPDRILAMLEQLREQIAKLQAPDREREKLIQRQMALATEQINTWYALVKDGKAEMHESLRERLTAAQRRIDQMTSELQEISRRRQLPLKKHGEAQVQGFAEAIRTEVLTPGSKFAKSYSRPQVSENPHQRGWSDDKGLQRGHGGSDIWLAPRELQSDGAPAHI